MTAPGHVMRCDKAGCNAAATVDQDAWSFCAQHAGQPVAPPRAVPTPLAAKPVVRLHDQTVQPAIPAVTSPIGHLLEQASAHSVAKVRRLAERIETQLDDLRTLVAEHAADERRKAAEAETAAQARAEVERLEAALAAAKAKLPPHARKGNTSPRTPAQIDAARRNAAVARAKAAAKRAAQS